MVTVAGVDVGSAFSKALILSDGARAGYAVQPSGGNYRQAARQVLEEALKRAGKAQADLAALYATGHGAYSADGAQQRPTEVSCLARGIFHEFPTARTIVDIGGQASKAIRLFKNGRVEEFAMSEKCAAGSGRFLQIIARVLHIAVEEIGPLSLKSTSPVAFSTNCAVFAESETVSRIAEGATKEDLLAGVHEAVALKIYNLVQRVRLEPDCALSGGGANDIGLVQAIERRLGLPMKVPKLPQFAAAYGAALMALEAATTKQPAPA
ncbi:MAG: 2-hydroxyglutaryl-CoA dehydratase [Chloroflexi bacterium]|nr:2-hydroxyglutaryl-CoA dehydratase [Chloroflexota bacterium]